MPTALENFLDFQKQQTQDVPEKSALQKFIDYQKADAVSKSPGWQFGPKEPSEFDRAMQDWRELPDKGYWTEPDESKFQRFYPGKDQFPTPQSYLKERLQPSPDEILGSPSWSERIANDIDSVRRGGGTAIAAIPKTVAVAARQLDKILGTGAPSIPKVIPLQNEDGSTSSEVTIGVEDDRLNHGRPTVIPTIIAGKRLTEKEAIQAAIDSKLEYPSFSTNEEADKFAEERSKSGGAVTHGFIGKIPNGYQKDLKDYAMWQLGEAISQRLPEADPRLRESIDSRLAEGLGNVGTMIATGGVSNVAGGAVSRGASTAIEFAGQNAGAVYDDAKEHGASESDASNAASWAGLVGAAVAPISIPFSALRIMDRLGPSVKDAITNWVTKTGEGVISGSASAAIQQGLNNEVAKEIYDKNRGLLDGVVETAGFNGLLGGVVHGLIVASQGNLTALKTRDGKKFAIPDKPVDPQTGEAAQVAVEEPGKFTIPEKPSTKFEEIQNATQEGIKQEGDIGEHPNGDQGGQATSAGNRNRDVQSGKVSQKEEVGGPNVLSDKERAVLAKAGLVVGQNIDEFGKQIAPAPTVAGITETGMGLTPEIAGQLGAINTDKILEYAGKVKDLAMQIPSWFRARGDLPPEAFDEKQEMLGRVAERTMDAGFVAKDARKSAQEFFGSRKLSVPQLEIINRVLHGEMNAPKSWTPELRANVNAMRASIDSLSDEIATSGMIGEDMQATFDENKNVYVHRSYKAFYDPKWVENVPKNFRDAFIQELRDIEADRVVKASSKGKTYIPRSDAQLQQRANELLYEARETQNPLRFMMARKLGSNDLDILLHRKDLTPAFRRFFGEETDPFVNYARTMTKMSSMLETYNFQKRIVELGMGKWLWPTSDPNIDPSATATIQASQNGGPLQELRTFPEISKAFEQVKSVMSQHWALRSYAAALGSVRAAKTVESHVSMIRNFVSNPLFLAAQGHYTAFRFIPDALKAVMGEHGLSDNPAWRDYAKRLTELRVLERSAPADELFKLANLAAGPEGMSHPNFIQKLIHLGPKVWKAGDDFYRVLMFEAERERYSKAFSDRSGEEIDRMAAKRVGDFMPTGSRVGKFVGAARYAPIAETFPTFWAEVVRNTGNTVLAAKEELSNPQTRSIGLQRLAGLTMALSAGAMTRQTMRMIGGTTRKQEDDVRRFAPEWQKDAGIVLVRPPDNGKVTYVDLSFTNPFQLFEQPIIALMRKDEAGWQDKLIDAGKAAMRPFLGENILLSRLLDVSARGGKTIEGREVYNPQDDTFTKAGKSLSHVAGAWIPGSVDSTERLRKSIYHAIEPNGRSYDFPTELTSYVSGLRVQQRDVRQSLQRNAQHFKDDYDNATRILTGPLNRRGPVSDEELKAAYDDAAEKRQALMSSMNQDALAAIRLGVPEMEVATILKLQGLKPQEILSGVALDPKFSRQTLKREAIERTMMPIPNAPDVSDLQRRYETVIGFEESGKAK